MIYRRQENRGLSETILLNLPASHCDRCRRLYMYLCATEIMIDIRINLTSIVVIEHFCVVFTLNTVSLTRQ